MASRLKRALSGAAVVTAVVALPLLEAGAAQAAIAGSSPFTTPGRPDLMSATVVSTSSLTDEVQVCFDKALDPNSAGVGNFINGPDFGPTYWHLVGYRSDRSLTPQSSVEDGGSGQGNPDCIDLFFNHSEVGDINQYTVVTADRGAVDAQATGEPSITDSVPLTGSATSNGTRGFTTQADLIGTLPNPPLAGNAITFKFDQKIIRGTVTPADFYFQDPTGSICYGTAVDADQSTNPGSAVTIDFPTSCHDAHPTSAPEAVANAVRVGVAVGGVFASADPLVPNQSNESVINTVTGISTNPAQQGVVTIPSLARATLLSNAYIAYCFDQQVNVQTGDASQFHVTLSDGTNLSGLSATSGTSDPGCGNGQEVDVNFDNLPPSVLTTNQFTWEKEYAVQAWVSGLAVTDRNSLMGGNNSAPPASVGGVTSVTTSLGTISCIFYATCITNSPGDVPIGGNAGAFARGYTTGPDAYMATLNRTTGVVTIYFDQRINNATNNDITLLTYDGAQTVHPEATWTVPGVTGDPGAEALGVQFDPAAVAAGGPVAHQGAYAVQLTSPGLSWTASESFDAGFGCSFYTPLWSTNSTAGVSNSGTTTTGVDQLDACAIPQVVPLTVVSGHLKAVKHASHKKHAKTHKKATKRH